MANGIMIPPWLKGNEPGELARLHATGLEIGQRAAAQQTQALMAMQEAQQRQQEAATRAAIAQQEIELETQKQARMAQQFEQEIGLKRQEEARMAELSAMRFAGGRTYRNTYEALVRQGMNPDDARKQAMLAAAPDLMAHAPGETMSALRQSMPIPPPTAQTFDQGIPPAVIDPRGVPHWPPSARAAPQQDLNTGDRLELQNLYAQKRETQDSLAEAEDRLSASDPKKSPKTYESAQKQIDRLTKKQAAIEQAIKQLRPPPMPVPPMPAAAGASANAAVGVRIREKKSGKIMRYMGKREDVPTSDYDILE
jgi:hypothetical protein